MALGENTTYYLNKLKDIKDNKVDEAKKLRLLLKLKKLPLEELKILLKLKKIIEYEKGLETMKKQMHNKEFWKPFYYTRSKIKAINQ